MSLTKLSRRNRIALLAGGLLLFILLVVMPGIEKAHAHRNEQLVLLEEDLALLQSYEDKIGDDRDVEFYFLGPKPFMQAINSFAPKLGIPVENVHFEFFGPSEDLNIDPTA